VVVAGGEQHGQGQQQGPEVVVAARWGSRDQGRAAAPSYRARARGGNGAEAAGLVVDGRRGPDVAGARWGRMRHGGGLVVDGGGEGGAADGGGGGRVGGGG
jgi:hypothetical protein